MRVRRSGSSPVTPGTVVYRGQSGGLANRSEGIHWTTDLDVARRFAFGHSEGEDPHIVSAVIDNPEEQTFPTGYLKPSLKEIPWRARRNYPGLKDGSLESENEVRVRPGSTLNVVSIHQFTDELAEHYSPYDDFDKFQLMGPHAPVTIEHKGISSYRNLKNKRG